MDSFDKIKENQDFYINNDGNLVICFDEYEVAPGYMGTLEFIISDKIFKK
ncbi:RsiV family protein [Clostridium butyricum]|nr:RsiV family protein [Clostridium butyricum]